MPRSRTTRRAGPRVVRRSSIASAVDSQMPLTTSTVLRSNSLWTRGFSPISAITAVASLLRSRLIASTRANSHSTPMVGRDERAKSICVFVRVTVELDGSLAGILAGINDTAGHSLAGVTGVHRRLVGNGSPVDAAVALLRDIAEVIRAGVNDDRGLVAAEQVLHGEGVRRRHQSPGAVLAHLQRSQVAAGGLA